MLELLLVVCGVFIGLGISWLFRYKLEKAISSYTEIFDNEIDALQEEVVYLEKIISILNDQLNVVLEERIIDEDEDEDEDKIKERNDFKMNIDDIIDKVNNEGIGSLTPEQKDFLDKYSK